jgi:hypothetical protein
MAVLASETRTAAPWVAATAASCDDEGEHPACHISQQDWGIPVRVVEGAPARVSLVLNGLDDASGG